MNALAARISTARQRRPRSAKTRHSNAHSRQERCKVEGGQRVRQDEERHRQARLHITPPTGLGRHPVDRGEQSGMTANDNVTVIAPRVQISIRK